MTNFAVTLNCAVLHLLQGSWLQTPVQKHGVWKNEMLCNVHYTSNTAVVCCAVHAGCQWNSSGWLLCISKHLFVVCAGWRMCCVTVSMSTSECCMHVLCYCIHVSPSECCIHVLCYCIHITFWMLYSCVAFWMLYPCAVLLYPHVTFWMLYPCAVTVSTSPSECCMHVLCYCIHVSPSECCIHMPTCWPSVTLVHYTCWSIFFFTFFTFILFSQMF